jgi:hypothetical protein
MFHTDFQTCAKITNSSDPFCVDVSFGRHTALSYAPTLLPVLDDSEHDQSPHQGANPAKSPHQKPTRQMPYSAGGDGPDKDSEKPRSTGSARVRATEQMSPTKSSWKNIGPYKRK